MPGLQCALLLLLLFVAAVWFLRGDSTARGRYCAAAWAGGFTADSLVQTSRNRTAPFGRYSFTRQVQVEATGRATTGYTGAT
jgi:hypothetical protein